jgi:hypothetical protein
MKCSATGNEKGDLLIQATAWAGLTVIGLRQVCDFIHIHVNETAV